MAQMLDVTVTEPRIHKKGYTIYKVSIKVKLIEYFKILKEQIYSCHNILIYFSLNIIPRLVLTLLFGKDIMILSYYIKN